VQLLALNGEATADAWEQNLAQARGWRADAIYVMAQPQLRPLRKSLADFALRLRLPSVGAIAEYAEAGVLVTYGARLEALYERAAAYVDKLLKGAKTSDLPIEQPTMFDLVINKNTARMIGVRIPESVLVRADKVIE
jgi:putative ABC transport system substrate-binding protein